MLFNSISFFIFLVIVFTLYWFVTNKNLTLQNILLLASSYFFYSCWDWRFLFLLIFSTLLDYFTGLKMFEAATAGIKKFWFWLSVSVNLGFLGVFKYYNFFAGSFANAMGNAGFHVSPYTLAVILPVGISFYTFHGLSYVIDIYKNRIEPERNFVTYSLFVSFFPLLVAGPIERATHLLPQMTKQRVFSYAQATDGLRQILWGLFKKIVIADQCGFYANTIFNNAGHYNGITHVWGALLFTVQIYGDFSGYSDIAIGTAKLFGIDLLRNFAYPYFSRDIAEFWRRWHISLSSWFRDYLYIPLGGSKGGTWMRIRNTFIIFLVSGFWHGANWTFIVWGGLNALFIMPAIILGTNRQNMETVAQGKILPTFKELISVVITFALTTFAWVFFRSPSVSFAFTYIAAIFSHSNPASGIVLDRNIIVIVIAFFVLEWLGREQRYALENFGLRWKRPVRFVFYYCLIMVMLKYSNNEQQFIYFQF